jgi:adenylate kinase
MRVALTGTPGTGKTSAAETADLDLEVIHLNDLITREGLTAGTDEARDTVVADLEAVQEHLADRENVLIESHLAHYLPVDRVIVLRCAPSALEERLRDRGESEASIAENAESEALDVVLSEAVEAHGREHVYEIDTTDRSPAAVAAEIEAVLRGDREPSAGTVDFTDYL